MTLRLPAVFTQFFTQHNPAELMKLLFAICCAVAFVAAAESASNYLVCVSNERGGTVSLIDGAKREVVATIPVGKRPRGLHATSDGKTLFVAVSGTPIAGPPKLDAKGNPIPEKDDDDDDKSDHSADGIAVIDLVARKFVKKLPAGSDPEQFAVSRDNTRLYIANEDVATASMLNIASAKVEHIFRVKKEPEGVSLSPDGKFVYVTCETGGEVFVIDTSVNKIVSEIPVGGRPRTVAFLPDGSRAFVPSESVGTLHVIDTASFKAIKVIPLPTGSRPMGTAMSRDGKKLYVSTGRGGTVCVIDTRTHAVLSTIKVGARPWGIALSPDGSLLFAANGPSNDVSVVDVASEKEIARIKAGEGPWGIEVVSLSP